MDIKELDIPYDVIIGRPDIRQHQLLKFDPELCLTSLEKPDKGIQPALINQVPPVVPATELAEDTEPEQTEQLAVTPSVTELEKAMERLWLLSERAYESNGTPPCPAEPALSVSMWKEPSNITAKLNVLREPKDDSLGVPADPVHNSALRENRRRPDAALPLTAQAGLGLTASQKWHSSKPDESELNRAHKDAYIHYEPSSGTMEDWNDDEIQYQRGEVSASMTDAVKDHSVEVRPEMEGATIVGDADLVGRLKTVCNKYSNVFSNTVRKEPAILPPMELEIDEEKWRKPINQTAPRKQSQSKKDEILTQIQVMILLGVIISSQAEYYSQVHLTPKPDNKWRFCIDYRWLNLSCKGMGWPLPHIGDMLQRLGEKKPKYYAKIDLTNGYHQAPLKKSSQPFTAFIAFCGLYEWTRVPMGLKGAPSYFQRVLANIVLAGLLYHICEVYIDDIIIHGRTKDEFVNNVERVFERLEKHKITVKPSKCFFGHE